MTEEELERMVPSQIMRLTQHYHNLIYIRYFFETLGQQPPGWIKEEMYRADTALQAELESEKGQGGLLHKGEPNAQARPSRPIRVVRRESGA